MSLLKGGESMYFQLSKCTFMQQFQYRESVFFQFAGTFMWVYIQLCIWRALLEYQGAGRTFEEMVVYVLVTQIIHLLCDSRVAMNLAEKVRTGDIAVDMIRPVSLKWYSFWEQFSSNLFRLLFTGCPLIVLSVFLWPAAELRAVNVALFAAGTGLAVVLNFYFLYTVGLLAFWFKDGTYARMLCNGLMTLFSGRQIPLWFYPAPLYAVCRLLPFRFMVYEPAAILLGEYTAEEALAVVVMQMAWTAVFWAGERMLWHKVQRQIEVQGG